MPPLHAQPGTLPGTIHLGIVYGLMAAAMHAVAFTFSRQFIVHRHGNSVRLLVISHTMMAPVALALLGLLWSPELSAVGRWGPATLGAAGNYLLGQSLLLVALRYSAPSRIVPLLALKVVAVAPLSLLMLPGTHLGPMQYAAVGLSCVGAMMLNRIGGRLPPLSLALTMIAVTLFACSDVYIFRLVPLLGQGFVASARAVCVCYTVCGLVMAPLLPWFGSRRLGDWRAALPYVAVWLPSMFLLFACLATCAPVLGNIVIGTRGLFAIVLGALLASRGMLHLEQHASLSVVLRRLAAAILMIAAILLYSRRKITTTDLPTTTSSSSLSPSPR